MTTNKRMIGIILPALVLVHTHEIMPLNRAIGTCVRFAGKSLVAATIIGIVSLPFFIKKEDIKEDTKTGKKRAFYEQLAKIMLGGMGTTAAFDYFARTKNKEGAVLEQTSIKDGELPEGINVSDKKLSADAMSKELRDTAGTVAAIGTLVAYGSKAVFWPFNHWPFKRSKKADSSPAHSSDQSNQVPLQISFNSAFVEQAKDLQRQHEELQTQLANLAESHNGANISQEDRQELINAFDQKLNDWFEQKQEYLNLLEGIYEGLLQGGTIPENLKNQEAIKNIMALIGEDVKQQLKGQREQIGTFLKEHKVQIDQVVKAEMRQLDTQNRTAREGTQQRFNILMNRISELESLDTQNKTARESTQQRFNEIVGRISELESFKKEAEGNQQHQLRSSSGGGWFGLFKGPDDSDQSY